MTADIVHDDIEYSVDAPDADDDNVEIPTADEEDSATTPAPDEPSGRSSRRRWPKGNWRRWVVFGILPAVALMLGVAAGVLKFRDGSTRANQIAAVEATQAAKDITVAMLSYHPDNVDQQLNNARDRLTGAFRDSYTNLVRDVVIPGAHQKQISATATVPAAAPVSSTPTHAVVLEFVNQTVVVGKDIPADTTSAIRVTLDKIGGRWLISQFDPI